MSSDSNREEGQEDELRRLAGEIAEGIWARQFSGRRVCPPNRLCCWGGYACHTPFYCDEYFGCIDRFTGIGTGDQQSAAANCVKREGNHGRQC